MTSKRIFLLKQLLWFLCQLYKIIKITLIFFVSLLYDCSDLLWFVSETLKHSLIFVETLTENQFRSIPYLDSSCELSNVFFTLGGIHQLRGPKFRGRSLKIQHRLSFDLNDLETGPSLHFKNSLKSMHLFPRLMGGINCR